ncbi:helix-turn-helix transcriptional regulator [Ekhidna sp.]|uniref:helix-turn-helix transcriptional regulator n=1 Tax=Ekhidna sp. TaxID=2608089 RepID=UPI00351107F6
MLIVDQCPPQETLTRLRNKPASPYLEISWPDVLVNAHYKKLEKEIPESAFTIFTVINEGHVHVETNRKALRFCEDTLFIVNPYEAFEYRIDEQTPLHMLNVHLSLDTYQDMISSILLTDENLLDDPQNQIDYAFTNHIHFNRPFYRKKFLNFASSSSEDYQLQLLDVLTQIIERDQLAAKSIVSQRMSTRKELFKRVAMGKDIIFSKYNDPELTIEALSREVSMSKFHFIRVFREAFGFTPHKLIQQIRIHKALEYIRNGTMTHTDIAYKIGLQETNSLYPLIREHRYQLN